MADTDTKSQYERLIARREELSREIDALKERTTRLMLENKPAMDELKRLHEKEDELPVVLQALQAVEAQRQKEDALSASPEAVKARKEVAECGKRTHAIVKEVLERVGALRNLADDYNTYANRAEELKQAYHLKGASPLMNDDSKYIGAVYQVARRYVALINTEAGERLLELGGYKSQLEGKHR